MKKLITISLCAAIIATTASADWREGDPYKMTEPQLPDPMGWDIDMTNYILADDWVCSQSGDVTDIHFWFSVEYGQIPQILAVNASIYSDVPAGTGGVAYSYPGNPLWSGSFVNPVIAGPWPGQQGWDDPTPGSVCRPNDHTQYWQVNITDIQEPFTQKEGDIYWLDLQIVPGGDHLHGWKTTDTVRHDAAVYANANSPVGWSVVKVCTENANTDFAFVITPEPATIAILGLGSLVLLPRKR